MLARLRSVLMLCIALSSGTAAAQNLREELASLTDVPYTTAVTSARSAEVVAWVSQRSGTVTLNVAAAPDFAARRLVTLSGDLGDTLEDPVLSADGRWLAYIRGPSNEPNGRTPNPAALARGLERSLWLIPVAGGPPARVAVGGESATFSPDARQLAFLVDGQLALVPLGGAASLPQPLQTLRPFSDMGSLRDLAWSPRSDAIAFVSARSAHAITGVFRFGADRVTWIAPSMANDTGISWAPDGSHLAILREPGKAYTDVADVMRNTPFAIWIADTSNGTGRMIYRSPGADTGLQTEFRLQWLSDGRVVFLSDASGYSQLYAVAPDSGAVTRLSSGDCDLESFSVDATGVTVAAAGNCFDHGRREVAVWSAATREFARASASETVATDPVFVGRSSTLFYRSATYDRAQAATLLRRGQAERVLGDGPPVHITALQQPEIVAFSAPDGVPLTGVLFRAAGATPHHPAPGVVFVHGGPIRQMLPAWYMTPYYAYAYAANQQLALRGINVLAVNYRTGVGFGRAFREVRDYGPHGAGELQDVIAAVDFLRTLPAVDPERIGIYGGSYGGHLAANALARYSDLFKAGVVWHGIYDFTQSIENRTHPNRLAIPWGASESERALAFASSALAHVATWRSPTLIVGGDDDRNVDFSEAVNLVRALEAAGNPPETLVLPNEVHGFLRHASWLDVITAGNAFLIDHLSPAAVAHQ